MTDSFAIAINSRVRDVIEQSQMNAVGDFSKLFSVRFTELIESDVPVRDAIERALRETGSTFRNLNPGRIRHFEACVLGDDSNLYFHRLRDIETDLPILEAAVVDEVLCSQRGYSKVVSA